MTDVVFGACAAPGCEEYGVFPGKDETGTPVKWCFTHDPGAPEPTDDELRAIEAEPTWNDEVVSGLAAIVLDHTAMSLDDAPDAVESAMRSLAEATNMPIDFAAGIILATSTMASVGGFVSEELSGLADVFEAEATDSPVPVLVVDDDTELCRWCESPDHTTADHERLYPQPWGHDDPDDDPDDDDHQAADDEAGDNDNDNDSQGDTDHDNQD